MVIEIREKGSEAFYTETMNATYQYRDLLKDPERKLRNIYKQLLIYLILCTVFAVLLIVFGILWGFDALMIVAASMMVILLIFCIRYYYAMIVLKNRMRDDRRTSIVTLDESGVELNKEDQQVVRIGWENVAFVRAFDEAVCFFAKDVAGFVIAVTKEHRDKIFGYIRESQPEVRLIG
ncbi:MAG: hypothetical protein J6Z38_09190 [Lachnospiraceae bacterium]|nr:hypothetical protein [Lachnospiraceae bacterium]